MTAEGGVGPRYAVYYAPPADHPLWQAGCDWLGRDARAGQPCSPPLHPHRRAPWRYGFHATLVAPTRLAHGVSELDWLHAVGDIAARQRAFPMPPLRVGMLDDFLALRPVESEGAPLRALARACVIGLNPLRAPLSAAELARRSGASMSERQHFHLQRYGYPHVLDDWRLHLTLSDPLDTLPLDVVSALRVDAAQAFQHALQAPLTCDALCVFTEPAPGQPFALSARFPLSSGSNSLA
jgi:hypothetical protein